MRNQRLLLIALVLGWGSLPLPLGSAEAEPKGFQGQRSPPLTSPAADPGASRIPGEFTPLLAAMRGDASQEGPLGNGKISALPSQGTEPSLPPRPDLTSPSSQKTPRLVTTFGRLPLAFIENMGQVDEQAKFYLKTSGQTLWLTREGIVFDLIRSVPEPDSGKSEFVPSLHPNSGPSKHSYVEPERLAFAQDFVGANKSLTIEARNPQPGIYNYFVGNDPTQWRTGVRAYAEVVYREVWAGIDLKLYGNGSDLEQEFIVKPGGDVGRIRVAYRGIEGLRVAEDGSLLIHTAFGELKETKPRIYQEINGRRVAVDGRFKLVTETAYTFELGPYHPEYALVIDPTLLYSTYLGGGNTDESRGIAVDAAGNVYVTGDTASTNFPATTGSLQPAIGGVFDTFVAKLNATGSQLAYATYLGGSGEDVGFGIAVDAAGNVYVTGLTHSADFPTANPIQASTGGFSDAFVAKLNVTGSQLAYATYLGGSGSDFGTGIAVDAAGNSYVTGFSNSTNFPTANPIQAINRGGEFDVVVTKLNSAGSALVYSTYLGGAGHDRGHRIAVDATGNAYVTGFTTSTDFPTANPLQPSFGGISPIDGITGDAFVTKLNQAGTALIYSTYLGGNEDDAGSDIAVDTAGSSYVTGFTRSSNFPITPGTLPATLRGGSCEVYVAKLNSAGSALVYSTSFGGSLCDAGNAIAVDMAGNVSVTGFSDSSNFPTSSPFQAANGGGRDAFVTKLDPAGSALVFSTFLGGSGTDFGTGIAVDTIGDAYVTGQTDSINFPTTRFAFQGALGSFLDAFVARFTLGTPTALSLSGILPDRGGDTGFVSAIIHGGGFLVGATVKLVRAGQPDVIGDPVTVTEGGRVISTRFDLRGRARGLWDIVVTNPDGTSVTLPQAFTIEEARAQVWVDIVGRETIRVGRPATFYIVYGNRGNVDALGTLVWIAGIPKDASVELNFNFSTVPLAAGEQEPFQPSVVFETDLEKVIPLAIPVIPPGLTRALGFTLTVPTPREFQLQTLVSTGP